MTSDSGKFPPLQGDSPESSNKQASGLGMLGKYRLKRPLGSGGMGTVYLAEDPENKRDVALKILSRDKALNPGLVKRFRMEAESASQLKHENIVLIYDAGEADGYLYIALEYVKGTDVSQLIKQKGPLPIRRSLEIIKQVTRALDHAFRQGIVHRDIKPSNMLIKRDGTVKLADMGLARSVDETLDSGLTRVGTTVGTVDYMAPEQARDSKSADVRSDIYSLGCAWYHMLTGQAPFPKGSITNKLYAHMAKPRPDPRKINERIPESIANTVRRMMSRSPKDRFQTPAELLDHLERLSSRPDPSSVSFVSALSEVVDSSPKTEHDQPPQQNERSTSNPSRFRRKRRAPIRNSEALSVFAILFGGLLILLLLWWLIVLMFPAATPDSESRPSPFSQSSKND
ncbi:MAG: hypothetical protein Tsb009_34020 [Planctomycetaceae bacterium]